MWTKDNRARYDRSGLRYPSDLTDAKWAEVAALIPPAKRGGNKLTVDVREVVNGLMYTLLDLAQHQNATVRRQKTTLEFGHNSRARHR